MDSAQHASLQPDREQNIISLSGTALPPSWQERMKERWHMGLWPCVRILLLWKSVNLSPSRLIDRAMFSGTAHDFSTRSVRHGKQSVEVPSPKRVVEVDRSVGERWATRSVVREGWLRRNAARHRAQHVKQVLPTI